MVMPKSTLPLVPVCFFLFMPPFGLIAYYDFILIAVLLSFVFNGCFAFYKVHF